MSFRQLEDQRRRLSQIHGHIQLFLPEPKTTHFRSGLQLDAGGCFLPENEKRGVVYFDVWLKIAVLAKVSAGSAIFAVAEYGSGKTARQVRSNPVTHQRRKEMRETGWSAGLRKTAALLVLTVFMSVLAACGSKDGGKYKITVEVVNDQGETKSYQSSTDAEVLYDALLEIDGLTLDGYGSDYGYYITGVNGLTADSDADGAYWFLYVNGEYGSYGVESQPVADGDTYRLAYELYVAE